MSFREQIEEILSANGWESQLSVESLSNGAPPERVRVTLKNPPAHEPSGLVNEYTEGIHPLEQVQQECLRAIRTGRPGI